MQIRIHQNNITMLLRLAMGALVILSAFTLLFAGNFDPAQADSDAALTLKPNDEVTVKPKNCPLRVAKKSKAKVTVVCDAPTATPTLGSGETVLSYISRRGDYIGQGQSHRYTSNDANFSATLSEDHRHIYVSVTNWDVNLWWYLNMAAPQGAQLVPGVYEGATRHPFQDPSVPGLDFSGEGRGCNTLTGRFQVLEATYTPDHYVQRFHATFEQHCEGTGPALFGEIQIVNAAPTPMPPLADSDESIVSNASDLANANSSDSTNHVGAKITRKLRPGQQLDINASECDLQVKKKSATIVVVFCKPLPQPPTPTRTRAPNQDLTTLYIRNSTGDQICFEVYGSGIGQKCFGGGDSLYGSFTPGTYSWRVTGSCGGLDGSDYFPKGDSVLEFYCGAASIRSRNSQGIPHTE